MTRKLQLKFVELTLWHLCIQLVLPQYVKHHPEMLSMLLRVLTEYQYIIKVDQHKLANMLPEYAVHDSLKCGRCIGQTKTQHSELIMPQSSSESSLRHIFILDSDLVITTLQVKG